LAGNYAARRFGSRRIYDHDEVVPRGNGERIARVINGSSQTNDTTVAKVVRADHGRIVGLIIGDAFDVARTVEPRVDRHGIATSAAARVSKGECLIVVRSGETTAGTRLACAGARARVPADPICLCRITRHELAQPDLLI